jgi:TetR/AcrR family transcriptional regulator
VVKRASSNTPRPAAVRQPRRSPPPQQRQRDPERTRERILQAALVEFGDKGFAGARVSQIAARAGVNEQLLSYYFGGKAGLYQALSQRWQSVGGQLARPELPLQEVVVNFFRASLDNRAWTRLLLWQGLADPGDQAPDASQPDPFMQAMVADLRRRQAEGELAADLDPCHVLVALFAAASAPVMLPHMVRRICGLDPSSEAFNAEYATQLARLVQHLAAGAR